MVGGDGVDADDDGEEVRDEIGESMADANLEGSRRENASRGRGAREIEVREESVAPW